jgi:hypothetical protein
MMNSRQKRTDVLQDRFGHKAASYLSTAAADLPYDISERLRAARAQAVSQRKITKTQTAARMVPASGSAALDWDTEDGLNWWSLVASVMPLIVLVVGLLAINAIQDDKRTEELAEVDAALLSDELPPAAFADPGFVQFLKSTRQNPTVQ